MWHAKISSPTWGVLLLRWENQGGFSSLGRASSKMVKKILWIFFLLTFFFLVTISSSSPHKCWMLSLLQRMRLFLLEMHWASPPGRQCTEVCPHMEIERYYCLIFFDFFSHFFHREKFFFGILGKRNLFLVSQMQIFNSTPGPTLIWCMRMRTLW